MAAEATAASLQGFCEEALCSICLEYFKDPVITECGHNFCRVCLTHYWEGLEGGEISCCPQCRGKVQRSLIPNRQLANFVDLTRKLRLQEQNSAEGKGGVCVEHQEPLKLFCKEDEIPLCVVCKGSKKHRDHQVVPLEEAAQDYKDLISRRLELLEEEKVKILACKADTEETIQQLLKRSKAEMEKTKEQFRGLISFLMEEEDRLLAQMEEVDKEMARNRDEHLARLSEELSSLGGLIQEMEEKRQQPPEELLQDFRKISERYEKRETFQNPVVVPPELKQKFCDVCNINPFVAKRMQHLRDILLSGFDLQKANVTLDPETAHPQLILSEDGKSVSRGEKYQILPDNPERFHLYPYVVGRDGFIAGRHYWEVTVESEGNWAIGVARKSVPRKEYLAFNPQGGFWAVEKMQRAYRASDLPQQSFLLLRETLRRIRVSLNYEEGQVVFDDMDTGSPLYTFSGASFSGETLLPFFCVGAKASLTISD